MQTQLAQYQLPTEMFRLFMHACAYQTLLDTIRIEAYHLGTARREQPPETHLSISQRLLRHTNVGWHSEASQDHAQLATALTLYLSSL